MFDLSKEKIEIKCDCGRKHTVTLQDAINKKILRCSCGTNIQLSDKDNTVKKSVTELNKAFKNLDDTFWKLGR